MRGADIKIFVIVVVVLLHFTQSPMDPQRLYMPMSMVCILSAVKHSIDDYVVPKM